MSVLWMYLKVFLVGGALCAVGELLVLRTRLTPARILVCYIIAGVLLSAIGVYGPLADFAGAGATVPLTGFGHALCQGVMGAVDEIGLIGAFTGGLSATAGRHRGGGILRNADRAGLQTSRQIAVFSEGPGFGGRLTGRPLL